MLYREAGQFKTTYAADQQVFPIRQDRIAVAVLLAVAASTCGAEDRNTITVPGKGSVRVRPDKLILVLGANGKAEKASDAILAG